MDKRTESLISQYRAYVEEYLKNWYARFHNEPQTKLFDAMEYSLLAGGFAAVTGRRLRPLQLPSK